MVADKVPFGLITILLWLDDVARAAQHEPGTPNPFVLAGYLNTRTCGRSPGSVQYVLYRPCAEPRGLGPGRPGSH